jgi:ribosomal protein S15P/S13E
MSNRGYRNDIPDETWDMLRIEYVSSDVSIRGLEKKHGISYSMIRTRCQNEKWLEQRDAFKREAFSRSVEKVAEHQSEECSRAFRLASKVMSKLEETIDQINPADEAATRNLKNITSAIKDLKEIGIYRSELDKAEQIARINKLRKEVEEEQKDTNITVIIDDEVKKYCK